MDGFLLSCGYILSQTIKGEQQSLRKNFAILCFYAEVNTFMVLDFFLQAEVRRIRVNGRMVNRDDLLVGLRNALLT